MPDRECKVQPEVNPATARGERIAIIIGSPLAGALLTAMSGDWRFLVGCCAIAGVAGLLHP
jgi:hypothetical protein